jgi:putative redox protein
MVQHLDIYVDGRVECETSSGWFDHIDRDIALGGDLADAQRQGVTHRRRVPNHRTLTSEVNITTSLQ